MKKKTFIVLGLWILAGFIGYKALEYYLYVPPTNVSYSKFLIDVAGEDIDFLSIEEDQRTVVYTTKKTGKQKFTSISPTDLGQIAFDVTINEGTVITKPSPQPAGIWVSLLIAIIPVLLLIYFMFSLAKGKMGGANDLLTYGKTRARLTKPEENLVRLKDVISNPGEHDEATEVIEFLNNSASYIAAKAKFPRGILLEGPPGVGKTLVAKAIAGEANVPFFYVSGSDFSDMFVGVGASRVRGMFEEAKKCAPCIIFIDEIDALAQTRGGTPSASKKDSDQTLMQLLVEMDGFNDNSNIIVLAATNRAEILDPALLRPGRFDRTISFSLPDVVAREQMLKLNLQKVNADAKIDTKQLAKGTPGFSGAEIANIVNEAALIVAKDSRTIVTMIDLEQAKDKVMMGAESPKKMSDEELKLTAYHEAGHAIVGSIVPGHDPVYKVSIVPRGRALGVTMFIPDSDKYSLTKETIESKIAGLLAGRAAEEIIFGADKITTGASNDLKHATYYARNMVTVWGLGNAGLAQFIPNSIGPNPYSEATAKIVDDEIQSILARNYARAKTILEENMDKLDLMATALLDNESISSDTIEQIMTGTYAVNQH